MNYQSKLDEIIKSIEDETEIKSLLLHACCGPCSSYVLEYLSRFFKIGLFFYNPNIYPEAEYDKRLDTLKRLQGSIETKNTVELIAEPWRGEEFSKIAGGLELAAEGGLRCDRCITLRLEETAKTAKAYGFEYFCTTLTVSPHKNPEQINTIGAALAGEQGIKWLYSDFKKRDGYRRSIELSRKFGLYRQDYCGCEYSKADKGN
jgi:predicted adenine nucleotide alpha hydrolase (AANH) superfamily ATPase